MVTITRSQAENMDLDKNTNTLPAQGFSFDGKSAPGTPFTNSTALRGDINNDGKITIDDATKLQRYIARIDSAAGDETFTARADVNGDGYVNIVDVTEIQRYLAEYITLSKKAQANADFNHDGKITIEDCTSIQYFLAEY